MSRPRVIQGEVKQRLLEAIEKGLTVTLACDYAGVSHDTWAQELKRNPEFHEEVTRARLRHLPDALEDIRKAGKMDHRAAKAWIEMVFREHYGQRIEVTGGDGGPIAFTLDLKAGD